MPRMKVRGLDFYYEIHGEGEPVILLNGAYGTTQSWASQVAVLSKNYRVYVYDCRDQGQTEVPTGEYVFEDHIEDLKALMDAWNVKKAHLVAISHGSTQAVQFIVKYPERVKKMVLISALSETNGYTKHLFEMIEKTYHLSDLKHFYKFLMLFSIGESFFDKIQPQMDYLAADFEKKYSKNPDGVHRLIRAASKGQLPFTDKLKLINAPVLLITGAEDRFTTPSRAKLMNREIKNSKLVFIPDCGHTVSIEKPEVLNPMIVDFLAQ